MFDREQFDKDKITNAKSQSEDKDLRQSAVDFIQKSYRHNYGYQWTWLGMPIIQMPEDIVVAQEIIWEAQPDVIIETGIAWGGSIVLYASILELIGKGKVLAIDKVLPQKNIDAIMKYPFSKRIQLFEGSSTDMDIFNKVKAFVKPGDKVMLLLDSNHTHEHVYNELKLWSPLVTPGQYIVVSDTIVEEVPAHDDRPRPWGVGNNPKTGMDAFLKETDRFDRNTYYNKKSLASFTPGGYLKCIK